MSNYPLVSVIVSIYKSELFIEGKLEDLYNQTIFKDLEIILINSGSPQNEEDIIKKFLHYKNVKYIKTKERETIYKAWNRGIKASTGKYITNSNTDDRLKSDALERLSNFLERNIDIALVYANQYYSFVPNETFVDSTNNKKLIAPDFNPILQIDRALIGSQPMWRSTLHFKDNLWFNEDLEVSGDHEFELEVGLRYKLFHLNEFLGTFYRSTKTNKSYENLQLTHSELRSIRLRYSKAYINKYKKEIIEYYVIKFNRLIKLPISLLLILLRIKKLVSLNNQIFSLEFIYLFNCIYFAKNRNYTKANKIVEKFLKYNYNDNLISVRNEILNKEKNA